MTTPPKDPLNILPYKLRMSVKYDEVNEYWEKQNIPYVTRVEAEKAVRKLMVKFGKPRFAPPSIKYNMTRYKSVKSVWYKTYVCLSGNPKSPNKGWRDIVHLISHKVYRYRHGFARNNQNGFKPHSIQQAELELEMAKYVVNQGWLNGVLKPKIVILSKDEKRNKKLEHYQKLISKWQTKLKLANTFIRKYNKKVKYLNKQ